ncbi:MAG: nitroreductase, partial [Flavobacteriales bacterium]
MIRNRRTIYPKDFSSRKVHKEMLEKMLENARWAPTHGMTQPWRFKVFIDEGREKLANALPEIYKSATPTDKFNEKKYEKLKDRALKSSAIIAVCMKRDENKKIPEIEETEAVACSVQNILLTATAYGLGAYWSTGDIAYSQEMSSFLELGDEDKFLGFVYIGYPDIEWPKSQRKPMDHYVQ